MKVEYVKLEYVNVEYVKLCIYLRNYHSLMTENTKAICIGY